MNDASEAVAVFDPRILKLKDDREAVLLKLAELISHSVKLTSSTGFWNCVSPLFSDAWTNARPTEKRALSAIRDPRNRSQRVSSVELPSRRSVRSVAGLEKVLGDTEFLEPLAEALLSDNRTLFFTSWSCRLDRIEVGTGNRLLVHPKCWQIGEDSAEDGAVPVICSWRNVTLPWTCRFDEELPGLVDRAEFPFCPPKKWSDPKVEIVVTKSSRPCWRDTKGFGWAEPDTPGAHHHWDVFLAPKAADAYGLGQLNITRFGAPADQGEPGSLHHVPSEKKGRLKKTTGWSC